MIANINVENMANIQKKVKQIFKHKNKDQNFSVFQKSEENSIYKTAR